MGKHSKIEWTDSTWNPVVGCSLVSPGCTNCYAMRTAARLERLHLAKYRGLTREVNGNSVWNGTVRLDEKTLADPLRWRAPQRIFVNSMSDLFHEDLPDAAIDRVLAVMALCQRHDFQVLTKRVGRMLEYMRGVTLERLAAAVPAAAWPLSQYEARVRITGEPAAAATMYRCERPAWPLPNVWLGVSVEDQARADERIPLLLQTPAAKRFLSCEPLLGPVRILGHLMHGIDPGQCKACGRGHGFTRCPNTGGIARERIAESSGKLLCGSFQRINFAIDWVIAGGESGPGARPMHPDWARRLRDQCQAAAVPFFFKQWGEWTPGENVERQQGIVETARWFDSRWRGGRENLAWDEGHIDDEPDVYRVGKRAAGRLLDGRTWDEMPA
jgi:protein gp37